jgi:nucleoside-diphosphate-sugar epimerase
MTKILITGANSFVGRNYRKFSQFKDVDEISLFDNRPEDINFSKYDVVLHLAAIVHQSKKIAENEYFIVNRDLCLQVATAAKRNGIRQFVFLSTVKVYGDFIQDLILRNEASGCFPVDSYGRSKLEAEIGLRKLEDHDFTVSIIRTPLVYGEGVKANMISLIKLIETIPLLPFKCTTNRRNYTYTGNLVGFIDQVIIKRASGVFIAMDNNAISTTDLVGYLSKYLRKKIILFKMPLLFIKIGRKYMPTVFERLYGSLEFDNSKTLTELCYSSPFTTEEGIKEMVESYKNLNKE